MPRPGRQNGDVTRLQPQNATAMPAELHLAFAGGNTKRFMDAGMVVHVIVNAISPDRMRRIGVLMVWPESDPEAQAQIAAFRDGLLNLGWAEGRNIWLDVRWSSAEIGVIQSFAKDLTDLQPDVFLATGTPAVKAIVRETRSVPIVFTQVTDPVAQGLVKSLERPGGNMTGITIFEPEIGGKWLQMLKEVAPTSGRVAVIFNPDTAPYYPLYMPSIEAAAATLDMKVIEGPVHNHADIEATLRALARQPDGGVIVMSARTLGLDIPLALLTRADEVID